jgi:hypothetical protein
MRAWLAAIPKPGAELLPSAAVSPPYPLEVRAQITSVLAGIILSRELEVTP